MLLLWQPNNPKKKPFPVQSISALEGLKRKYPGKFAQYGAGGSIEPAEVKEIKKKDAVVVEKITPNIAKDELPRVEYVGNKDPKTKKKSKKRTVKKQSNK